MTWTILLGILSVLHVIYNGNLLGVLPGVFLGILISTLAGITVLRNSEFKVAFVATMTIIFASLFLGSIFLLPGTGYYVVERGSSFYIKSGGFVKPFDRVHLVPEEIDQNVNVKYKKANAEVEYEVKVYGKLNASKEDVVNIILDCGGYEKWLNNIKKEIESLVAERLNKVNRIPAEMKISEVEAEVEFWDFKLGGVYEIQKMHVELKAVKPLG
jgi:hypothetical protein